MFNSVLLYPVNPNEQFSLGRFFEFNKDMNKAIQLYTLSADQGNADAQLRLGACYVSGYGVEKDMKKSIELYTLSADQGNANAQFGLGSWYSYGYGVEKDIKKAIHLYTLSADQGNANAQYNLANCYENGEGVEKDMNKAMNCILSVLIKEIELLNIISLLVIIMVMALRKI